VLVSRHVSVAAVAAGLAVDAGQQLQPLRVLIKLPSSQLNLLQPFCCIRPQLFWQMLPSHQ